MKTRNKPKQFPLGMGFTRLDAGDILLITPRSGQSVAAAFGQRSIVVVGSDDREALQKFLGISADALRPCDGQSRKGNTP